MLAHIGCYLEVLVYPLAIALSFYISIRLALLILNACEGVLDWWKARGIDSKRLDEHTSDGPN